jgi:hypothetical protein
MNTESNEAPGVEDVISADLAMVSLAIAFRLLVVDMLVRG